MPIHYIRTNYRKCDNYVSSSGKDDFYNEMRDESQSEEPLGWRKRDIIIVTITPVDIKFSVQAENITESMNCGQDFPYNECNYETINYTNLISVQAENILEGMNSVQAETSVQAENIIESMICGQDFPCKIDTSLLL